MLEKPHGKHVKKSRQAVFLQLTVKHRQITYLIKDVYQEYIKNTYNSTVKR